jgi:hypothetical protein
MDLHTILPIASLMSGAITLQLAEDFDPNIWVVFDEFVSVDKAHVLAQEGQDIDKKIKSPQQILAARGEDPEAAPWGEFPPGSIADVPYTGEERDFGLGGGESVSDLDEPDDEEGEESAEELDGGEPRALGIRVAAATNWEKPAIPANSAELFDPEGWGELFAAETDPIRKKAFLSSAQESLALLGLEAEFIFTDAVGQALKRDGAQMVKLVNQTTAKRIRKALTETLELNVSEGETLKHLTKSIDEIFKGRRKNSATIARTEMHKATQSGQMESFVQADVPFKTWLDARDSNVRETHFQEGILPVPRDDNFILPSGASGPYPGQMGDPAEDINCRCDAAPVFDLENNP